MILLLSGLLLGAYFSIKRRSRRGLWLLAAGGAAYFGFYRQGCVCAPGSLQNIAAYLGGVETLVPLSVAVFFLLPLLLTIFFGRAFCAGICPLGAAQELVLLKKLPVNRALATTLGFLPHIYLTVSLSVVAAGGGYLICRHDPFVSIFWLTGNPSQIAAGALILLLAMLIGRPYCRFLCPYGVLLGALARLSVWRPRITPSSCRNCRLCHAACPYGAIEPPAAAATAKIKREKIILLLLLILAPALVAAGFYALPKLTAGINAQLPAVKTYQAAAANRATLSAEELLYANAFEQSGKPLAAARSAAAAAQARLKLLLQLSGAYLGLILALKLIGLSCQPARSHYTIAAGRCYACGRCFAVCPQDLSHAKARQAEGEML